MRPPRPEKEIKTASLFQPLLVDIIDPAHELVALARRIDWQWLDDELAPLYSGTGRAGNPTRLMVGLHLLKHAKALSDEEVCRQWKDNPYFQFFCGEDYFRHDYPIERSSMTHWRKRIGSGKLEKLISELLRVACEAGIAAANNNDRAILPEKPKSHELLGNSGARRRLDSYSLNVPTPGPSPIQCCFRQSKAMNGTTKGSTVSISC